MSVSPDESVTFLFSEIEESAALWRQNPYGMQKAMVVYDSIFHQALTNHGGTIFKTIASSTYAAFKTADAALSAAIQVQKALAGETWEEFPLKTGLILHSAECARHDGEFIGAPVKRAAHILAAAHGGQTLFSLATRARIITLPEPGLEFINLGEQQLEDLIYPETLYELVIPSLPADFPPVKTLNNLPNNLPQQPDVLVGRAQELDAVQRLMRKPEVRLLTLMGLGGTGKTRLSLQVGASLLTEFKDGVFFVDLSPARNPNQALVEISKALNLQEVGGFRLIENLKRFLYQRQMLLVLDNFEQVIAAADLVNELLAAAPLLKILVTSRILLRLYGEHEFQVPPLALPNLYHLPPLEELRLFSAIDLFVQRAQLVQPDFILNQANAAIVVNICAQLDGLPLAIELAAAKIKSLTPQALLDNLADRFGLLILTGGSTNRPLRQQTLRYAIEWGYDLLQEEEKLLFDRLGVFSGPFSLEAVEDICNRDFEAGRDTWLDAQEILTTLINSSFIKALDTKSGEDYPNMIMLDTLRGFAQERLEASGESPAIHQAHLQFFTREVEVAEPHLNGSEQVRYLRLLEKEHPNLQAALDWGITSNDSQALKMALTLAGSLWRFWQVRGYLTEGRRWLESILQKIDESNDVLQPAAMAKALHAAAVLASIQGDYQQAVGLYGRSLSLRRQMHDVTGITSSLNNLGIIALYQNDFDQATVFLEESLALRRHSGDKWGICNTLTNLANVALAQGDFPRAETFLEESLTLARELEDKRSIAICLYNLGNIALNYHNFPKAAASYYESFRLRLELGDKMGLAETIDGLAAIAGVEADPVGAAQLYGAALHLREELGAPFEPHDRPLYERFEGQARAQVGEEAFAAALKQGREIPFEQLVQTITKRGSNPDPKINLS
jgi:predicted ATPase/class 3 adenylate cyclase